jgi:50S ribosomal protein L16 3-hydroxylase
MTSPSTLRLPDGIDRQRFLDEIWQRRPLLMRGALAPGSFTLSPDELAGLACEAEVESRLVVQHGERDWQVRHGPFDDADFAALPAQRWTLLVQDVDKFVPAVAGLLDQFDFVPTWRIDDIMVSYAADGGGVGPHTDAYDVLLVQASGRRRWRISYADTTDAALLPGLEQRILAEFATDEEWVLQPGDILYLPPGVAHWGTADGDCMTYSIGFRSPSRRELAADWFQWLVEQADDTRLRDPAGLAVDDLTRITAPAVAEAAALLATLPDAHSASFANWLGCFFTEPKPQFQIEPPPDPWDRDRLRQRLAQARPLHRHPWARLNWMQDGDGQVRLFCQGESSTWPAPCRDLAAYLAKRRLLDCALLRAHANGPGAALLLRLLNDGVLEDDVAEDEA